MAKRPSCSTTTNATRASGPLTGFVLIFRGMQVGDYLMARGVQHTVASCVVRVLKESQELARTEQAEVTVSAEVLLVAGDDDVGAACDRHL